MQISITESWRRFNPNDRWKDFNALEWLPMYDDSGNILEGIRGKVGAIGFKIDKTEIGVDLIEMQPGTAFPFHMHAGDHILYGIQGNGFVHIDKIDHPLGSNVTIFIPAEYPHGVHIPRNATEPCVLLAFGHPHKHVSATDRMQLVKET